MRFRWSTSPCRGALTWLLALLLMLSAVAHAQEAQGFRRRLWTTETGTPADIWAMAQGKDGYLWLGTGNGLYRFDGVRFERFQPPQGEDFRSNDITALAMLPDGTLWIGFYYGGVSVLRNGHLLHYASGHGLPGGMVSSLVQTPDGMVWAATEGGLARFDGRQWSTVGKAQAYPSTRADWLLVDHDGTLWVTTGDAIVFLPAGGQRFVATDQAVMKSAVMAQAPDGVLWVSDHLHGTRALPGLSAHHPDSTPLTRPDDSDDTWCQRLLFDRYGNAWGTLMDKGGIFRVASAAALADGRSLKRSDFTEIADRAHGLVSDHAVPLLQDVEGTVWAGTNLGLASFHRNHLQVPAHVPLGSAATYGMAVDSRGDVWVANAGTLYRVDSDGSEAHIVRSDLHDVSAMLFNTAGELWMVGRNRLYWLHGSTLNDLPFPVEPNQTRVSAFTFDAQGQPWLAMVEHGLYRLVGKQWQPVATLPSLAQQTPTALASDGDGPMWIGYPDNQLVRVDGNDVQLYTAKDGLGVGTITTLQPSGHDLLIGGEQGMARWRDGHIRSIGIGADDVFSGISGLLQAAHGDVWMNTGKGVVRMPADDVDVALDHPGRTPGYRLFDYRDGLPGIAVQAAITPTMIADGRRHLWFLTNQGPAWIDPATSQHNPLPPPVAVLAVIADGVRYAPTDRIVLPKGTTHLQVQYTAASLAVPDRVRFRYRLDGVDERWQEVGNRREAFYANLSPGTYRFRVMAANDDGVWNTQGAEATVTIRPWFFQTLWFYLLCLLLAATLVMLFFLWRLRLQAERVRLQLTERTSERERIARDIHDTLLQGVQGLLLRLQALMTNPVSEQKHADTLNLAIVQARQMVIEGRDKIIALRGDGADTELAQTLLDLGESLEAIYPDTRFHLAVHGRPRAILASAQDEILDIAREAIRNAYLHAGASSVDVLLNYERRALRIRVADDGTGIDEGSLSAAAAADRGHWGIVGMKERADRLGARLLLRPLHPRGTEWWLRVPCRMAFRPNRHGAG